VTFIESCSGHLRRPAPLTGHVISPALAAAGEVLAVSDQPLVQLAGEHWNAVHPSVVPEPVAGHADLAAAGFQQHLSIEVSQRCKDKAVPYISHLIAVSGLVWEDGGTEDQAIAGLLHDAIEDAGQSHGSIAERERRSRHRARLHRHQRSRGCCARPATSAPWRTSQRTPCW
jgi:hypothetical protein